MSEKTFTAIDLTTACPPSICKDCAQHGLEFAPSGAEFVYCECSKKGAARERGESWMIFEGLSAHEFKQKILDAVMTAEILAGEIVAAQIARDGETAH